MNDNLVHVRVWGDFACFTRPELKVERVSYPLMTPSAARGIMEAIFWEPQIYYLIDSIRVVKRGRWLSFQRNEVTKKISLSNVQRWMKDLGKVDFIEAGGGAEDGTQRNMLALEDVEYIITAEVRLTEVGNRADVLLRKYVEEIKRRAASGKCFHRPYLGVRECAADFEFEADAQSALERRAKELGRNWQTIWPEEDLGLMLYDLFDPVRRREGFRWLNSEEQLSRGTKTKRALQDFYEGRLIKPQPLFFRAQVRDSRLECHPDRIELVRRNEGE